VAAHRAAAKSEVEALIAIDRQVLARKPSDETRTMSTRMGRKFTEIGVEIVGAPLIKTWLARIAEGATPGCYPVALGGQLCGAGPVGARGLWSTTMARDRDPRGGAAADAGSHVDTQAILMISTQRRRGLRAGRSRAALRHAGFAPLSDILAAVHTKAHVRLFMN